MSGANPNLWLAFRNDELLVVAAEGEGETDAVRLPSGDEWEPLGFAADPPILAGMLHGTGGGAEAWAAGLPADTEPPAGMAFRSLRRLWGKLDEAAWSLAGRAVQLVEWDRTHRYCGRCGAATARHAGEHSRVCPRCALSSFPRISPAVIVRIERGDEILLARSPRFAPGVYSTIAGFVEPGESLEQTVVREVREEVGVEVANVRYFGSQPWPFPHSLMVGFVADWQSGEIRLQEEEIEAAGWFRADTLPPLPNPLSIARALIDDFTSRRKP